MTTEEMGKRIVEFVAGRGSTSFPEIIAAIGSEAVGDQEWHIAPNTILWVNMSPRFIDAFQLVKPMVWPTPSSPLVYAMDGAMLDPPVAKRISRGGYKTPHWMPVVFNLSDAQQKARRKR